MQYRFIVLITLASIALWFAPPPETHAALAPQDFVERAITRTNFYRQKHGCGAVTLNTKLQTAAQGHSDDMAQNDFFDHKGSNGSTFEKRIQNVGYAYWSAAENIAAGFSTPESVIDAFYNEKPPNDGHRRNLLNCDYSEVGIGYTYLANDTGKVNYHHYWTQDFGQPRNAPQITATPTRTTTPAPPTVAPHPCAQKPGAPRLLSPKPDAQLNTATVLLDWNDNSCPVKYRVTIKRNSPTGPSADAKGGLTTSQYTTKSLAKGTYAWSVRVCNDVGCRRSGWRTFNVR